MRFTHSKRIDNNQKAQFFQYMLINQPLLDTLTAQAKASARLRMHFDLQDCAEDESQRILNALEPGKVVPIHMHGLTSEDFIILRGRTEVVLFDEVGNEMEKYLLESGGEIPAIHVPKGRYHTCRSLEEVSRICFLKTNNISLLQPHLWTTMKW